MSGDLVRIVLDQHLYCPSMWAVFPLQDWLALDDKLRAADANSERINFPANPNHYWRWRCHLSLEELLEAKEFNSTVATAVQACGRAPAVAVKEEAEK